MVMNLLILIVATIASMVLGMIWYSPSVFGSLWIKLSGWTAKDMRASKNKGMGVHYFAAFVGSLVTAFALDMLFNAIGVRSLGAAFAFGVIIWIGFILTTTLSSVLWEGKKFGLYALNNFYTLVNILLVSAIVATW